MQNTYMHLLNSYAAKYEFPCSINNETLSATIDINGWPLRVVLHEPIAAIAISCAIAPAPEKNKEKIYGGLLQRHACFIKNQSCVFGLDSENKMITLQTTLPIGELDDDAFEVSMSTFMETALGLVEEIGKSLLDWEYNEESVQNDETFVPMMHMLRV